jgi:hypothetical protein
MTEDAWKDSDKIRTLFDYSLKENKSPELALTRSRRREEIFCTELIEVEYYISGGLPSTATFQKFSNSSLIPSVLSLMAEA